MKKTKAKTLKKRAYKPTEAELAAILKGEAALARGDSVSLEEFMESLHKIVAPKVTKAIAHSTDRFQTGRYED